MRSTSIYPVAHAKHTLTTSDSRPNTTQELHAFPHSREKDASLDVTIPGSIQQASGWKLLHLHHQGTPQHDGSVESWVLQTSPWRPSRSQMTKKAQDPAWSARHRLHRIPRFWAVQECFGNSSWKCLGTRIRLCQ